MELYEALEKRRTVREWSNEDVGLEEVERVIRAGMLAPTHNHRREWDFIVLHNEEDKKTALQFAERWSASQEERKEVASLGTCPQRMYAYAMPRQHSMLATAPYVVIPIFKAGPGLFSATAVNGLNSFASIWCVIENMFLAATAEGLACSMRIPVGEEGRAVLKALGVPVGYMMPCYIGIGHPADDVKVVEQVEVDMADALHFGRW